MSFNHNGHFKMCNNVIIIFPKVISESITADSGLVVMDVNLLSLLPKKKK